MRWIDSNPLIIATAMLAIGAAPGRSEQSKSLSPVTQSSASIGRIDWTVAVEHYAAITAALAADKTAGLSAHAKELTRLLGPLPAGKPADGEAAQIRTALVAATRLSEEKLALEQAREVYKSLSEALVPLANLHYMRKTSDPAWAVFHCSMAPGSWIQAGDVAANPYYGSKMLKCGIKESMLGSSGPAQQAPAKRPSDHSHHGGSAGDGH